MKFRVDKKIGLSKTADFLGLAATWFLFSSLFSSVQSHPGVYVAWVLLTSALSMFLLGAMGYFEHHIPKPEYGGIISLICALPFSAFLAKKFSTLISGATPVASRSGSRSTAISVPSL